MDMFDKVKQKMKNFDPNTALSSTVATLGSMTTNGWVTIGYFFIAAVTSLITIRQSNKRFNREDVLKQIEIDMKKEELRSMRLDNDQKQKGE